ncbi:MAG: hypothetical protein LQ344_007899 [Seirophora lacunosa]|nr:MAG: hypothetical protein LQ344_007899 [Seirophora lacunosa]
MSALPKLLGSYKQDNIKILVSPSGFKESLDPKATADHIEAGILRVVPKATIVKAPLIDGGEGFVEALVAATNGSLEKLIVMGPTGKLIPSHYGFLGCDRPKTAVIEMAASAGLRLVPKDLRDPGVTSTFGVGQTIVAALRNGAQQILLGCGDSGTCDAGVGMAQALGAKFYAADGHELPLASGGKALVGLAAIDLSGLSPLLRNIPIQVACNWHNVLCGPLGVARIFGPQKGATVSEVEHLALAMDNFAAVYTQTVGRDVSLAPGSGASGGLGAGLMLIGAQLYPRYDIIMQFLQIDQLLDECDLVFTAEGGLDFQTPRGKIPAEVAQSQEARLAGGCVGRYHWSRCQSKL